jgi:hypothetical protein
LIAALSAPACGSARNAPAPDATEPPAEQARVPLRPAPMKRRWARLEEVLGWPALNARAFTSRGHAGARYVVDIHVDPANRADYLALLPNAALRSGTLIAAVHHDPVRGRSGPIYVMEKVGADWTFSVVSPGGTTERRGEIELCRRCHAEAPQDFVFGLPASARPAADAGP